MPNLLRRCSCVLVALGGLLSSPAWAQEFQMVVTDPNTDAAVLRQALGGAVDDQLRMDGQTEFLQQMATATALSAHGMGVDYASNPQRFVVGGGIGSAVDGAGFGYGDGLLPASGFAFQVVAMGGFNLGAFADDDSPLRRFVLYGHGMGANGGRGQFSAYAANGGGNLQIQLLKVRDAGAASWGGIAFTTGFARTIYELTLSDTIPLSASGHTWQADGAYEVVVATNSIPIELSTNMRAGFFTVYGGGGVDIITGGTAESDINLYGDIMNGNKKVGEALITWSDSTSVSNVAPRVFGGVQINILPVKLYGQLNISPGGGTGAHTGVRIAM